MGPSTAFGLGQIEAERSMRNEREVEEERKKNRSDGVRVRARDKHAVVSIEHDTRIHS